jgi:hypothetical protein
MACTLSRLVIEKTSWLPNVKPHQRLLAIAANALLPSWQIHGLFLFTVMYFSSSAFALKLAH